MKKAIIGMIMSMVIVLGIGGFVTTINYYENRLAEADSKYRRDIDEVENLKDKEYDEMKSKYDEAIYNIVNGENYELPSITMEKPLLIDKQTMTAKSEDY